MIRNWPRPSTKRASSLAVVALTIASACTLERSGFLGPDGSGAAGPGSGGAGGAGPPSASSAGGADPGPGPTSASTGGAPVEDCLDGLDDDGDTLADCDDPDCGSYTCVDAVMGALAYLEMTASAASCPADSPALALSTCSGCACNATAGTCSVTLTSWANSSCTSFFSTINSPTGPCLDVTNGNRWGTTTTTPLSGGCSPAMGTVPPVLAQGCSPATTGACGNPNQVCVPVVPSATRRCVLMPASTLVCPAEYPTMGRVYTGSVSQCSCTCNTSLSCATPTVTTWTNSSCNSGMQTYSVGQTCTSFGNISALSMDDVTSSAACAPISTPVGGTEQVICCTP